MKTTGTNLTTCQLKHNKNYFLKTEAIYWKLSNYFTQNGISYFMLDVSIIIAARSVHLFGMPWGKCNQIWM